MYKQVIIVRKDLGMRKGKIAAQVAHASIAAILPTNQLTITDDKVIKWLNSDSTKIVVSVDSEDELLSIYDIAKEKGLLCSLIQDKGFTEFNRVLTYTCVAIGPDNIDTVDSITSTLKLM